MADLRTQLFASVARDLRRADRESDEERWHFHLFTLRKTDLLRGSLEAEDSLHQFQCSIGILSLFHMNNCVTVPRIIAESHERKSHLRLTQTKAITEADQLFRLQSRRHTGVSVRIRAIFPTGRRRIHFSTSFLAVSK
jgi:hypothetical protein